MKNIPIMHHLTLFLNLTLLVSCASEKNPTSRTIEVREQMDATTVSQQMSQSIDSIFSLFGGGKGLNKSQICNLLEKCRTVFVSDLAEFGFTTEQIVDALFELDRDHNRILTESEVQSELHSFENIIDAHVSQKSLHESDLRVFLVSRFEGASPQAIDGLLEWIYKLDDLHFLGNADHVLSGKEVSPYAFVATLITDFEHLITLVIKNGQTTDAVVDSLKLKLRNQIYGRYDSIDVGQLSANDKALEWAQLVTVYYLSKVVVENYAHHQDSLSSLPEKSRGVPVSDLSFILKKFGIKLDRIKLLFKLYDHSLMQGNEDGVLDSNEFFNLITDLRLAQTVQKIFAFSPTADTIRGIGSQALFLGDLYPTIGNSVILEDRFWQATTWFDSKSLDGNRNRKIDLHETALILAYLRITDVAFERYDMSHDQILDRNEMSRLFVDLGQEDVDGATTALLAGNAFNKKSNQTPLGLIRIVLSKATFKSTIDPTQFFGALRNHLAGQIGYEKL